MYILTQEWKQKNILKWYRGNRPHKRVFTKNQITYDINKTIKREKIKKWTHIKQMIKNKMRTKQYETWKNDKHGRILKKYKNKRHKDKTILLNKSQSITTIRKMRIGCSDLCDHKSYQYDLSMLWGTHK